MPRTQQRREHIGAWQRNASGQALARDAHARTCTCSRLGTCRTHASHAPCTCLARAVHMPYACGMHAMCMHCACASTQALAAGLFPVRFVTGRAGDVALAFGSLWHSSSSAHPPSPPRLALLFEYAPSFVKPLHRYAPALVARLVPFPHRRLFPQVRLAPRRGPAPAHKAPARRRACPLHSPPPLPHLPPCRKGRRPAARHAATPHSLRVAGR